jgi:dienelactone hydrolase
MTIKNLNYSFTRFLLVALTLISTFGLQAQDPEKSIILAKKSIQWMQNDSAKLLVDYFTEEVSSRVGEKELKEIWNSLTENLGPLESIDTTYTYPYNEYLLVESVLKFHKGQITYRLTLTSDNKIGGIFFVPRKRNLAEVEEMESEFLKEKKVSFINDDIEFPAKITLPKGQAIKALVVLVHGSGPNDMDETIGPNKIFAQIAHTLATQGIASIRYDKRTYLASRNSKIKITSTMEDVVISDAIAAAAFLRNIDSLKNIPIFVVGHSLGGHFMPVIISQSDLFSGGVSLAGNSRPLEDLIVEQYQYLFAQAGLTREERKEIKKIKKEAKNVKNLEKDLAKGKIKPLPLINDTTYWLSMMKYDVIQIAQNLNKPMLFLQGGRDYQVSSKDLELWHNSLKNMQKVDFILYHELNHLMMPGSIKSYPEEYEIQGVVSDILLKDLSNWLLNSAFPDGKETYFNHSNLIQVID